MSENEGESMPGETDKSISEAKLQRGVCGFMGRTQISEIESASSSTNDNPWVSQRSQPTGKISVNLPPEDGPCMEVEKLQGVLMLWFAEGSFCQECTFPDKMVWPPN